MIFAVPEKINRDYIRSFRNRFNLTQGNLAELLNVSKKTVESWESGNKEITGPATTAIMLINENPELLESIRIEKKIFPLRYIYMAGEDISTIIDVDYVKREIRYKNYTNDINRRAFGLNENATFTDFEDFLKSRCFPETRDKMKIQLKELNLPFYDPAMIIEKTEGRMAEDNYWLKVDRS